jgi:hypothetical protein
MSDPARYAIYWAPNPDSPLGRFGAAWLDPAGRFPWPHHDGTSDPAAEAARRAAIAAPSVYGFHATLKPPFRLAGGADIARLQARIAVFAASRPALRSIELTLAPLGDFLALVPAASRPDIDALAASCVRDLDAFRAPPTDAELARRRAAGLSVAQEALLRRWGYPYVMEAFRFHMTLTGRLDRDALAAMRGRLEGLMEAWATPVDFVDIALFRQSEPGGDFVLVRRFALGG